MIIVIANVGLLPSEIGKKTAYISDKQLASLNQFIECIRLPIIIGMLTS